jgi:hypothetical protein
MASTRAAPRTFERVVAGIEFYMSLLTPSKRNPKLSAYQDLFGNLDFESVILVRIGQAVQVNIPADERTTYGPRSEPGIYLYPALDSHRTHHVYMYMHYMHSMKHMRRSGS